jgi:hypothetical protein
MTLALVPPKRKPVPLDTYEEVFDALTSWLKTGRLTRRVGIEMGSLGFVAKLYESDQVQATGRGTSTDGAVADALESLP